MKVLKDVVLEEVLFIDIETSTSVKELEIDTPLFESWKYKKKYLNLDNIRLIELYKKEAALYADFGRIICISIGRLFKGKFITTTFNDFDEGLMINKFFNSLNKIVNNLDNILLCGHTIKTFDIPYIFQRSIVNSIKPHILVDTSGEKAWTMSWILDIKDIWQAGGVNKSSLLNITTVLNLPSSKTGITGADVPSFFWENPKKNIKEISNYCELDVTAVYNILRHFLSFNTNNILSDISIIKYLKNGGHLLNEHKIKLKKFIKTLNKEEQKQIFDILYSIVSLKNNKRIGLTIEDIKELKI